MTRSNELNRYYWSCIIPAAINGFIEVGYFPHEVTPDAVHEFFKQHLLRHMKKPTTTTHDNRKFKLYIEACCFFIATEFFIYVPLPNDND